MMWHVFKAVISCRVITRPRWASKNVHFQQVSYGKPFEAWLISE